MSTAVEGSYYLPQYTSYWYYLNIASLPARLHRSAQGMLQGYKRALGTKFWPRVPSIIGGPSRCTSLVVAAKSSDSHSLLAPIVCSDGKSKNISIYCRQFASSPQLPREDNKKRGPIFFYRRNPKDNRIPRGNIAFCFAHTTYWSWYAERCAEVFLLENGTASFYLHPTAGMYGLTFAMVLNFACYQYSTLIISKMAFHAKTRKVQVWFHKLPFLTEAEAPVEFELGEVFLDRSKAEVIYLLEKLGGDTTDFRGHLPLMAQSDHFKSRFPLLVYCNDGYVVKDNNVFLEALLFDKQTEESEDWQHEMEESAPENGSNGNTLSSSRRSVTQKKRGRKRKPGR